jgi:hypothetical protein
MAMVLYLLESLQMLGLVLELAFKVLASLGTYLATYYPFCHAIVREL